MIKVKATSMGYFGALRHPGDVFEIKNAKQLGSWMERIDEQPAQNSTKQAAAFNPETASEDELKDWLTAVGASYPAKAPIEALQQLAAEVLAANA